MKYYPFALLILLAAACTDAPKQETAAQEEVAETKVEVQPVQAVCIWDQVSLREAPSAKGKWVTALSLGEVITSLGEKAIDSTDNNRSYTKVRLADGTEGWSVTDLIIEEGTVAVFLEDKETYRRPDLLTKTENKFSQMDIVAIVDAQDDWRQITGRRSGAKWIETTWVKSGGLSEQSIDVAVAKFASQVLKEESEEALLEGLKELVDNEDLKSSSFIPMLNDKLAEMMLPEEGMMDVDSVDMQLPDSVSMMEE